MLSFAYAVRRVKRAQEFSRFLLLTQNTSDVSLIRKCHVTDCWRRQESRGEHGIDISSLILILSAVQCLGAVSICLCPRAANKHAHVPAIFAQHAASQTHSHKTYFRLFWGSRIDGEAETDMVTNKRHSCCTSLLLACKMYGKCMYMSVIFNDSLPQGFEKMCAATQKT